MLKVDAETVRCPKRKCFGVLFDATPRLAVALGRFVRRCDKCGGTYSVPIDKEKSCT